MKLAKPSLYRRIRKIKASEYRRGRAENQFENDRLIEQLRKERDSLWATYQAETNNLHTQYKKQIDAREQSHQEEVKAIRKEQLEIREKDKETYKGHITNLKNEAVKKIGLISERAKREVERATHREAEYQQLTSNTMMLFQEVMAKLKVYGEEQQNLMGNAANQVHKQNEIEKLYQRFVEMVKSNSRLVGKMKMQQIEVDSKNDQ